MSRKSDNSSVCTKKLQLPEYFAPFPSQQFTRREEKDRKHRFRAAEEKRTHGSPRRTPVHLLFWSLRLYRERTGANEKAEVKADSQSPAAAARLKRKCSAVLELLVCRFLDITELSGEATDGVINPATTSQC